MEVPQPGGFFSPGSDTDTVILLVSLEEAPSCKWLLSGKQVNRPQARPSLAPLLKDDENQKKRRGR